ncbi:MAG: transposase [Myxococcales bacterium]|nr:transposase [Myxococcales bacterium]
MPRTPRLDFRGARHHVMNRASSRRAVFTDDEDLDTFLAVLQELPRRFALRIHGWALMSTHYHLMVEVPEGNLSDAMHHLGAGLAQRMNRRHGWDGPLFRGRFRNRLVLDEPYWRHLAAYLHLNPVAAGLLKHPDDTCWTSHRAYAQLDTAPAWLTRSEVLRLYGDVATYRSELDDLVTERARLPADFDEGRLWLPVNTASDRLEHPEATFSTLDPAVALDQVARAFGVDADEVRRPARGRGANPARRVAAWWLLHATALNRAGVGERLGMSAGSVGTAAWAVRHDDDPRIVAARETLERGWRSSTAAKVEC